MPKGVSKVGLATQLPRFPSFRTLTLDDKSLLDLLLDEVQPQISELTFTNLFAWNGSEPVELSCLDETVLLQRRRLRDSKTFLLPPLGKQQLTSVVETLRKMNLQKYQVPPLYGLTVQESQLLNAEGVEIESDRDDWDYVYLTTDLANLLGDKYHPKRNLIARCLSKYKCKYVSIGPSEINECLQLQTEWCSLRNCSLVPGLEAENTAIKNAFENYDYLGLTGGVVYVDDKPEAFALAEELNSDTAVVHFEKANPEVEGLYQVINQWFCKEALGKFKFVNREQDLGVPGLRKAKENYYPHHMVEKCIVQI
jgi:hypothetical protein